MRNAQDTTQNGENRHIAGVRLDSRALLFIFTPSTEHPKNENLFKNNTMGSGTRIPCSICSMYSGMCKNRCDRTGYSVLQNDNRQAFHTQNCFVCLVISQTKSILGQDIEAKRRRLLLH